MQDYNHNFLAYLGLVFTLALILLLGLVATYQPTWMATTALALERESIARGKALYARDCIACHGPNGRGMENLTTPLNSKEYLSAASEEIIFNVIADGRPGTTMPAWAQSRGGPYTDQTIRDLVAYIRAWEATAPSTATATPESSPDGEPN